MVMLVIGVAIWCAGHLLPAIFPEIRRRIIDATGPQIYRGLFSLDMAIALVLIVWGYRSAAFVPVYDPPTWGVHVNNPLMLVAVYLFGVGPAKGWLATKLRHPMLLGVVAWSVAHLLANGDQASVVLFGAMGAWALAEIALINRRAPEWEPPAPAGTQAEIRLVGVTLIVYAAIALIHGWVLGAYPF